MKTERIGRTRGISSIANARGATSLHAHVAPIFQSSSFSFETVDDAVAAFSGEDNDSFVYTRGRNPNAESLARRVAWLEARSLMADTGKPLDEVASARIFSSGMGAISALATAMLAQGDTAIVQSSLYGGTFNLFKEILPRMGISVVWVDGFDVGSWQDAVAKNPDAKLAYLETPSNPMMSIVDIKGVADACHAQDIRLAVDNTFATPVHQLPLSLGADYVVHSLTKFITGHATNLGGAVISRRPEEFALFSDFWVHSVELGASPSPFECWLTEMGMKTLELRMERHSANAMQLAQMFEQHDKVATALYPGLASHPHHALACAQMHNGFSGLMTIELATDLAGVRRFLESLTMASLAISLGSVDTLIQCPALMTHSNMAPEDQLRAGIKPGSIRLSVGIETIDDLMADFAHALDAV